MKKLVTTYEKACFYVKVDTDAELILEAHNINFINLSITTYFNHYIIYYSIR